MLTGVNYTVSVAINGALINNTPRTGTLSLVEGSTTLASINVATTTPGSNGYYALTVLGGLPAGTYSNLKVTYSGDSLYSALSSAMGTVTVANDVLALAYASSQTLVGQPFWLNVAIQTSPGSTAAPTGTLTLTEGTITLATLNVGTATANSSGYYTLNVPAGLALGTNSLKVAYSGDANYAAATSAYLTITGVTTIPTSVGLSYSTPLAGQAFTMNAIINPTAAAGVTHTGTLALSDNGSTLATLNLATATPSSSGYYALSVPAGLPTGSNVLVVSYSGDANYGASSATATLTVNNDSLSLSYSVSVLTGVNYTASAAINGALINNTPRTGTLSLVEGSTTLASLNVATTAPNSSGYYALTVPGGLPAGTYSNLKVTYTGDSLYSALSSSMGTVTVANDLLSLSYASSQDLIGQPFSMNVAIQTSPLYTTAPSGTITLTEGTTTLAMATASSSGYYTLTVPSGFALGSNTVQVAYSGDTNYAPASTSLIITGVTTLSTNIGLSYSTPFAGQAFTMNAIVNPTALAGLPHTGTLTLSDSGSILATVNLATATPSSSGYYALTVPAGLSVGSNALVVSYSGNSNYAASTATATVTVNNDQFALSYASSQTLVGQSFALNVAIQTAPGSTAVPTGTLTLSEGTTTLAAVNLGTATANGSGYYTLTVPGGLAAGSNSLKVAYSGDTNYVPLSSSLTITGVTTLSTSVALSYATPLAGLAFTMNAAVNPTALSGLPHTGTLTLSDNGSILATVNLATATPSSSGYYALSVPAGLTLGSNVLVVSYSGDSNYAASSATTTLLVNNDSFSYSVPSPVLTGVNYMVSVYINGALVNNTPRTGTLSLFEGSTTLASVNVATTTLEGNGSYALTVPGGLPVGAYSNLKITYTGDSLYSALSMALPTVTVTNDILAVTFASTQILVGQPFSMNVAIQTSPGSTATPTGTLTLTVGTTTSTTLATLNLATATANGSGYYTLTVPGGLALGSNSLKVAYSGDANYAAASTTVGITGVTTLSTSIGLNWSTPLFGQAFTMNAEVNPTALAGLTHTGTLTLSDNGSTLATVNLATATPNSSGYYALTVPGGLPAGSNALIVSYSGDSNYAASSATASLTVNDDSLSLSYSTVASVGQPYTVNVGIVTVAGVTAIPTGTLTLMEGTTVLATINLSQVSTNSSGKYALTVPGGLAAGPNSLKVVYSGDVNFTAVTVTLPTVTAS